jgi:hypothetical protein
MSEGTHAIDILSARRDSRKRAADPALSSVFRHFAEFVRKSDGFIETDTGDVRISSYYQTLLGLTQVFDAYVDTLHVTDVNRDGVEL